MSIIVNQKPSDIQPAQSPIVFSVITSGSQAYTASGFQYTANLYIWSGIPSQSGSYLYQARKYPNPSGSGIFDFSKMINSTLTRLAAESGNAANNIKYYKVDFGFQYESGSTYVTQSGALTSVSCSAGGTLFKAYDGYSVFPDAINASLYQDTRFTSWPFMTDMTTVTQSVTLTDRTYLGNFTDNQRGIPIWIGANDNTYPSRIAMTASYTDSTRTSASIGLSAITGSITSSHQIFTFATTPGDASFYGLWNVSTSKTLDKYVFNAYSGSVLMASANYEVVCPHYYEPIRIAYKNKYGQFDFFNFYKRHDNQFNTDQRVYQPQLGTWNRNILSYNQFQTAQQRYIVDATEVLSVNSDWVEEGYNNLFKQLMVSDEIYWVVGPWRSPLTNNPSSLFTEVKPLTVQTNSLQFKTHVNNKLIQYTFTFDIGQPYKLLL